MKRIAFATLVTLTLAAVGCSWDPSEQLCPGTAEFDIDLFVEYLEAGLGDTAGYEIAVNRNGNLYLSEGKGSSIYPGDPGGAIAMQDTTRMNVASVSKFIGTIALMQVMEKHNIGIDEPIYDYLPARWQAAMHTDHYDIGSPYMVRFENMLRMETGIAFPGTNWSPGIMPTTTEMLQGISQPAAPNRVGVYQNGNFTLIRVLIGELEYGLDDSATDYNEQTTDAYFDYIKKNIFDKLGIHPPMSADAVNDYYAGTFTRAHQWPFDDTFKDGDGNVGWGATSDPTLNGGSGGLVLSSLDLAEVAAYFKHDESGLIISAAQRDQILDNELGLIESTTGEHGRYQSKGGTRGPEAGTNRALRSRVMFFPNGVEAVVLTNSNITNLGTLLRTSFDDAWVSGC